MRKAVVAAVLAAAVAVLATAAWGATKAPNRVSSASNAGSALVKCGKTRSIGLMAPFTGPAASIGVNQVHWANFFKNAYNRSHKKKIKFVNEDTMLGSANGTAEAVKGAQALGSNAAVLGVIGPAGSNEVKATTVLSREQVSAGSRARRRTRRSRSTAPGRAISSAPSRPTRRRAGASRPTSRPRSS